MVITSTLKTRTKPKKKSNITVENCWIYYISPLLKEMNYWGS